MLIFKKLVSQTGRERDLHTENALNNILTHWCVHGDRAVSFFSLGVLRRWAVEDFGGGLPTKSDVRDDLFPLPGWARQLMLVPGGILRFPLRG